MASWHRYTANHRSPYKVLVGDQLRNRHVDQMHRSKIERPDRSADVSETFPRNSANGQILYVQAILVTL